MVSERYTVHRILRVLAWGIVGVLLAVIALLVLAVTLPFLLGELLETGSVSESVRRGAQSLIQGLGSLGPAVFGLIIALVVILVLLCVGLAILERNPPLRLIQARDEAYEALKLRYVKGEITKEQFLEMKKTLESNETKP